MCRKTGNQTKMSLGCKKHLFNACLSPRMRDTRHFSGFVNVRKHMWSEREFPDVDSAALKMQIICTEFEKKARLTFLVRDERCS